MQSPFPYVDPLFEPPPYDPNAAHKKFRPLSRSRPPVNIHSKKKVKCKMAKQSRRKNRP